VKFVVDKAVLGMRRFFLYRLRTITLQSLLSDTVNRRASGRGTFKHSSAVSDVGEHGRKDFFTLLFFFVRTQHPEGLWLANSIRVLSGFSWL
jgi:hypothetical protein